MKKSVYCYRLSVAIIMESLQSRLLCHEYLIMVLESTGESLPHILRRCSQTVKHPPKLENNFDFWEKGWEWKFGFS